MGFPNLNFKRLGTLHSFLSCCSWKPEPSCEGVQTSLLNETPVSPHHPANSQLASTSSTPQLTGGCGRTQVAAQPGPDQTQQRSTESDQFI